MLCLVTTTWPWVRAEICPLNRPPWNNMHFKINSAAQQQGSSNGRFSLAQGFINCMFSETKKHMGINSNRNCWIIRGIKFNKACIVKSNRSRTIYYLDDSVGAVQMFWQVFTGHFKPMCTGHLQCKTTGTEGLSGKGLIREAEKKKNHHKLLGLGTATDFLNKFSSTRSRFNTIWVSIQFGILQLQCNILCCYPGFYRFPFILFKFKMQPGIRLETYQWLQQRGFHHVAISHAVWSCRARTLIAQDLQG